MSDPAYFVYTAVLLVLFVGVLVWAFGKKRKKRFEQDAMIPFQDEPSAADPGRATGADDPISKGRRNSGR